MSLKTREYNFPNLILFLGSPFFAVPFILRGIYLRNRFNLHLFTLLSGIIAYMYIPHVNNDKASYFLTYTQFSGYSWRQFMDYTTIDPNILFNFLLYSFSSLNISFQLLFFLLTYFVVGTILYVFNDLTKNLDISKKTYFSVFILLILSISLPRLFSGIKFYLGSSLLLLSFYTGIVKKSNIRGLITLVLAILTHFSLIGFLPVFFLAKYFPHKTKLFRLIFIFSFIFLIVPKSLVYNIITSLGFGGGYATKVQVYLEGPDFLEEGLEKGTSSTLIVYLASIVWSYAAYVYLLFTGKMKSHWRSITYLLFAITNIFYGVPFVFSRFLVFVSIVFALLLISELGSVKKNYLYLFLFLFFLNFFTDIITMRYNIEKSFFSIDSLTSITIFLKDKITYLDFLR